MVKLRSSPGEGALLKSILCGGVRVLASVGFSLNNHN